MPWQYDFFYIYRDDAGKWRWRLWAKNEEILADSGQSFTTRASCERNIGLMREVVPVAPIHYAPNA